MTGPCGFCGDDLDLHGHDGRAWHCLVCSCEDWAEPGSVTDVASAEQARLLVAALNASPN